MLFTGSRGIGKTSCARILAKALNCQQGPTVDPCGTCSSCSQIIGGTSVDVFEIDGASNNSVEQIREIRESVKFLPANGRRKIYIIDEVHMLSTSAFNALLKTLEEPPEHVLFIFATTEPHKIPDTIISRCQRYDFKRIQERAIVDALSDIAAKEGLTVEEAALFHVAREAHGGMRDSLSLLDQVIAYCGLTITEEQTRDILGIADRNVFGQLVTALLKGDSQEALNLVNVQYRRGLDLQKFAAEFVRHLRDLLVVRVVDDAEQLVDMTSDQIQAMREQVLQVNPAQLHRMFNAMLEGAEAISRSSFPKLSLEMVLLRLSQQGTTMPLADVLKGLERLEDKLNGHGIMAQSDVGHQEAQDPTYGQEEPKSAPLSAPSTEEAVDAQSHGDVSLHQTPTEASESQPPQGNESPPWEPIEGVESAASTPQIIENVPVEATPEVLKESRPSSAVSAPKADESQAPPPPINEPTSAPATPPEAEPSPVIATENHPEPAQGLKSRPGGEGAYDDFSASPPQGQDIHQLRELAVKPRTHLAIPQEEVRPFLVTAATPPTPIEREDDGSAVSTADGSSGDVTPHKPDTARVVVEESMTPLPVVDLLDGEEPIERFTRILDVVQSKDAFLGSELTQCLHLVQFDSQGLCLAVLDSYWRTIGASAETLLRGVVQTLLGDEYPLTIDVCETSDARTESETVFERKQRLQQEHREFRRGQARHAPQIVRAQELLNAEIVDVQLISTPTE